MDCGGKGGVVPSAVLWFIGSRRCAAVGASVAVGRAVGCSVAPIKRLRNSHLATASSCPTHFSYLHAEVAPSFKCKVLSNRAQYLTIYPGL